MRSAAIKVRDEWIRLGLKVEDVDPALLEQRAEELVDLARRHKANPVALAREFAYRRAAEGAAAAEETAG
jgi:hypothetical protein